MKLNMWLRCYCGKLHIMTFVSPSTRCKCGVNLHDHIKDLRSLNA